MLSEPVPPDLLTPTTNSMTTSPLLLPLLFLNSGFIIPSALSSGVCDLAACPYLSLWYELFELAVRANASVKHLGNQLSRSSEGGDKLFQVQVENLQVLTKKLWHLVPGSVYGMFTSTVF